MNRYNIIGLTVNSEFELPYVSPIDGVVAGADVTIRFRETIAAPENIVFDSQWLTTGDRDCLFRAKIGLSFRIQNGTEISICRLPEISDSEINLFLMGSVWGVLCHQRGLLPLHWSSVRSETQTFAFTGPSGAGKSTLAAALSKRGYRLVCDDVCVVDISDDHIFPRPMPKEPKLWRDATDALGIERGAPVSTDSRLDKFYVSLPAESEGEPANVAALYILTEAATGPPRISRLRGGASFEQLHSSVYLSEWIGTIRHQTDVFSQVSELASKLPLFEFSRPKDMTQFDYGLDLLEEHMACTAVQEFVFDGGLQDR